MGNLLSHGSAILAVPDPCSCAPKRWPHRLRARWPTPSGKGPQCAHRVGANASVAASILPPSMLDPAFSTGPMDPRPSPGARLVGAFLADSVASPASRLLRTNIDWAWLPSQFHERSISADPSGWFRRRR